MKINWINLITMILISIVASQFLMWLQINLFVQLLCSFAIGWFWPNKYSVLEIKKEKN